MLQLTEILLVSSLPSLSSSLIILIYIFTLLI
jgi:hypothetical protein